MEKGDMYGISLSNSVVTLPVCVTYDELLQSSDVNGTTQKK
jgi:hypothetical protein